MQKAFTLIELLVVVLIIGILSAVALPQYQVAVLKSRYMQLISLTEPLAKAQQIYFLENNRYTKNFDDLAVSLPSGGTLDDTSKTDRSVMTYPAFEISLLESNGGVVIGNLAKTDLAYLVYPSGRRECRVHGTLKQTEKQVCASLGARLCTSCAGSYLTYVF